MLALRPATDVIIRKIPGGLLLPVTLRIIWRRILRIIWRSYGRGRPDPIPKADNSRPPYMPAPFTA
jgi:hypothetical protein